MKPTYDVNYFIAKFEAIPDERWITGHLGESQHCALGHCTQGRAVYYAKEPEAAALELILNGGKELDESEVSVAAQINDDKHPGYQQPTPRARILAALYDIKSKAEAAMDEYERRPLNLSTRPLV